MRRIQEPCEMRALAGEFRQSGRTIGFTPTMGCLHAGHLSLMERARQRTDVCVVSVFVNPTQFGPGEDYERYPRTFERDLELCAANGVDVVFAPDASTMYAPDHSVFVVEDSASRDFCGASRPDHFRGVLTVVAKLFHMVNPHLAVFGRKDAQQAFLVRRMARDLGFDVEIDVVPIVREPDGLAMSSRNRYLSTEERRQARSLSAALRLAQVAYASGERNADGMCDRLRCEIETHPEVRVEYFVAADSRTLRPVSILADDVILLLAARVGKTRLIDNAVIGDEDLT